MFKRILSVVICILFLAGSCIGTLSASLPLSSISAPQIYTYYTNSQKNRYVGMQVAVPKDIQNVLRQWRDDKVKFKVDYGVDELNLYIQFDWSIDSMDAWHHTSEWDNIDGQGFLAGVLFAPMSTMDMISNCDVFNLSDPDKQALFTDSLLITKDSDGNDVYAFDYDAHKLSLRARFILIFSDFDAAESSGYKYLTSEWSDIRSFSPLDVIELDRSPSAPQVSNMQFLPDTKQISFEVELTDEFIQSEIDLLAQTGQGYSLVAQVRMNGGSWMNADMADMELPIVQGKRFVSLPDAVEPENLYVEYRMRYIFMANELNGFDRNIKTPWSDTVSYGENTYYTSVSMHVTPIGVADCGLCHNCSAPGGICLYIWLGVILAACIILYMIIIIRVNKRSTSDQE